MANRCSTPCWNYIHRGGRCLCGTNASRASIGMAPLSEEEDKPLDTPEHAEYSALQTAKGIVGLIVVVLMALVAAFW